MPESLGINPPGLDRQIFIFIVSPLLCDTHTLTAMAVKKRQKALSHGRPPVSKAKEQMSSRQSRTIINTHHRLHKELANAKKKGDTEKANSISAAIEKNGGLKAYQTASKQGQDKLRGGDTSKVLVEWLQDGKMVWPRYKLLEVGALSTENKISQLPTLIHVTRIDLNSQGPGIEQQDFMERPLPKTTDEQFDIVSLSLVLNYVPDPTGRGEMLKRVTQFLRRNGPQLGTKVLPALFLVLPLPCVSNSRYLDEDHLVQLMSKLGFDLLQKKDTSKLCHYLFRMARKPKAFKREKKLLRDGPTMNNFCIVIE
jgi:25S rRNA (adenine2142-N1)-methyltransferase